MLSNSFRVHVDQVLKFSRSLVIKFDYLSKMMIEQAGLDPDTPPDQSPYYRTLAGDHTVIDEPILIYSPITDQIDTQLTKQVLLDNPEILTFYRYHQDAFEALLDRYPEYQFLILNIFDPIDLNYAINAPDFSVLRAGQGILADNLDKYERDDIVEFLDRFLYILYYRWYINVFEYEDMYPVVFWSMAWNLIPLMLIVRRIMNLRTRFVHPYYVWEYLTSNGFESFRGYLSRDQEMFLYRNNEFLQYHVGKEFILDILEDVFLNPIYYSLRDANVLYHVRDSEPTADKEPYIVYSRDKELTTNIREFDEFHQTILDEGLDPDETILHYEEILERFKKANTNFLMTKFIEIVKNQDDEELFVLMRFILDSVTYLVSQNKINFLPSVIEPVFDKTVIEMSILDLFNLMHYCIYRMNGLTPTVLPTFYEISSAITAAVPPVPGSITFVMDSRTYHADTYIDVQEILDRCPYTQEMMDSPEELSNHLGEQFKFIVENRDKLRTNSDAFLFNSYRAVLATLVPDKYGVTIQTTTATYTDWFTANPLIAEIVAKYDTENNPDYYALFIRAMFNAVCPLYVGFEDIAEDEYNSSVVVKKIRSLFEYLTSYNIRLLLTPPDNFLPLVLPTVNGEARKRNLASTVDFFNSDNVLHDKETVEVARAGTDALTITGSLEVDFHGRESGTLLKFFGGNELDTDTIIKDHVIEVTNYGTGLTVYDQ